MLVEYYNERYFGMRARTIFLGGLLMAFAPRTFSAHELALSSQMLGVYVVTSYQSLKRNTDSTPFRTSINERTNSVGIAAHPSLLCPEAKCLVGTKIVLCKRDKKGCDPNTIHYFDLVWVEDVGFKTVNDVMAAKTTMNSKWDVWVASLNDEKAFHKKFKNRKLRVWLIKGEIQK